MNCKNKVILITGASSGIGAALAIKLAKNNNQIIITARRENLLKSVCQAIESQGSSCDYYSGDATDEDHAAYVVQEVIKKYHKIDVAILNVGIGPPSNTLTASAKTIKHCMDVNYNSFINYFVPIIKQMKTQKEECIISHMNSQATWFGIPMQGDYTAAKGAARLFIETARMELIHFGYKHILLQSIHPGFVDTEAVRNDGIPAPFEISEEAAADYVIKGIEKNWKVNTFPAIMKWQIVAARLLPSWLLTKVLLSQTPKDY